jgi:hypothetical protein
VVEYPQHTDQRSGRQPADQQSDADVIARIMGAHIDETLALPSEALSQRLLEAGCRVLRVHGRGAEDIAHIFECLLHAAAHKRGRPLMDRRRLQHLSEADLLWELARRACSVDVAQKRSIPSVRQQRLGDWNDALDEWVARLFADLWQVVWTRVEKSTPPFPVWLWFRTDPRTGNRRPTGEQIEQGQQAWAKMFLILNLAQLEELATDPLLHTSVPDTASPAMTDPASAPQMQPVQEASTEPTRSPRLGHGRKARLRAIQQDRVDAALELREKENLTAKEIAERLRLHTVDTLNKSFDDLGVPRPWS